MEKWEYCYGGAGWLEGVEWGRVSETGDAMNASLHGHAWRLGQSRSRIRTAIVDIDGEERGQYGGHRNARCLEYDKLSTKHYFDVGRTNSVAMKKLSS